LTREIAASASRTSTSRHAAGLKTTLCRFSRTALLELPDEVRRLDHADARVFGVGVLDPGPEFGIVLDEIIGQVLPAFLVLGPITMI
jgi:hypothetical protein